MRKVMTVLMTVVVLAVFVPVVAAQGGEVGDPATWLPDDLTGFLGVSVITGFLAWVLGGGMSTVQVTINNLIGKLGYLAPSWVNTVLSFVFVLVVVGVLLAINVVVPPDLLENYEANWDLIRGFILLVLAYGGNQAAYYTRNRIIQTERKQNALLASELKS